MSRKRIKKEGSYKRVDSYRFIEDNCLLVEFFSLNKPNRIVACINGRTVFLYELGKEFVWDYYLENDEAVDFRYTLGGMYYDFIKYVERFKAWKIKKN